MKAIVVYQSKSGFTKKYGEWIAKELSCDVSEYKTAVNRLKEYEVIIYGGGLMAGRVAGLDKLRKNIDIKDHKLIVFATGATAMAAMDTIQKIKKDNLTIEEQKEIPFYYFEGGINYENMGFPSKMLLKGMCKSLEKKKDRTAEETGMMNALKKSNDNTDRAYIKPLVEYVKGL